jgi:hypothetical protein
LFYQSNQLIKKHFTKLIFLDKRKSGGTRKTFLDYGKTNYLKKI